MGHSSGASVVQFLIASPALPPHTFRNAIAVSAVPVMAPRINWRQTRLLLHDLGCTNITTSNEAYLALSDRWWHASSPPGVPRTTAAELDCLRARPGLDLLRYQRNNEAVIQQFAYFCESSAQLPAVDFAQLLRKNIKPKSLLIFGVRDEMPSVDVHVREQCREQAAVFGYHSREFFEACRRRYTRKQSQLVERVVDGEPIADRALGGISAESCHANAVQTATANRRAGGDSYRAAFWMRNYTFHVSDASFFIGFHRNASRKLNAAERLMDDYYPRMIRSFVRNGRPHDRSWRPSDAEGRGFQVLDFVVADNGTLTERPEFHSGYDDPSAVRFWLRDGKRIEEIAKRKRGRKEFKRFESTLLYPALTVLSSNFSGSAAPIDHVTVDSTDTVGVSSFLMLILATLFAWLSIFILVIVPFWWAFERWRNTRRRYRRWLDGEHDEYTPIKNADL